MDRARTFFAPSLITLHHKLHSYPIYFFSISSSAARRASSEASALLSESNVQLASAVAIAMVMAGLVGTHNFGGEAREALTLQEWMWALQGGYLNTMTSHFINHGGL